jgi:hypothetical protein
MTTFFVLLLEVSDIKKNIKDLVQFKKDLNSNGQVTVIEVEQTNYDFLYNSLIEKANKEKKAGAP